MSNGKFGWQKVVRERSAKRTLAGKANYNRRRKPKPRPPERSHQLRCPKCETFRVVVVREFKQPTKYRCDNCQSFIQNPISGRDLPQFQSRCLCWGLRVSARAIWCLTRRLLDGEANRAKHSMTHPA